MEATEQQSTQDKPWFYEDAGQRKGGLSHGEIVDLIKSGKLSHGSTVWKKGFTDWITIENTELRPHLDESSPPPLTGGHVNNTVVWILAFAPLLGFFLEAFIAGMIYSNDPYRAESAAFSGEFFYITIMLNVALSFWDEKKLKNAGTNTEKFNGMVWLVPVYLYQRAKALKQNLAYFITWIACFVLVVAATQA